jgi:hypothetical protein
LAFYFHSNITDDHVPQFDSIRLVTQLTSQLGVDMKVCYEMMNEEGFLSPRHT